jgi:hypothetical protein
MMRAKPFDVEGDADSAFLAELKQIREARRGIEPYLVGRAVGASDISEFMRQVRGADLASRRATFIDGRLRDQESWYSQKASWNRGRSSLWYWSTSVLQLVAFASALIAAIYVPWRINFVSVVMTVAASLTAWSQAKRHDELANSYSVAAQELHDIAALISASDTEGKFAEMVDQGEEAVSREHTMWCARRSITLR